MEESHPGGVVAPVQVPLQALHDEVEGLEQENVLDINYYWLINSCLREAKEEDDVDDGEGEHVPGDHGEDHGHEGPGELDGTENIDHTESSV